MYAALVRAGAETAGFVGFVQRDMQWGRELGLGWLLRRRFWGKGYATEAAQALRPLAPARVISLIRCENNASANVGRKLGMTIERETDYRGFKTSVWVSSVPGSASED
jgi:RimJ/RimL family protein N-acetyltransferase